MDKRKGCDAANTDIPADCDLIVMDEVGVYFLFELVGGWVNDRSFYAQEVCQSINRKRAKVYRLDALVTNLKQIE